MQLDWPDVKTASLLCSNGICKHKIGMLEASCLTKEWSIQCVTPTVASSFGDQVGETLAKSLLWAAFNRVHAERLPAETHHQIASVFMRLEQEIADGVNPVKRVEVVASAGENVVASDVTD